jgi:DegV family protein with EDD domain
MIHIITDTTSCISENFAKKFQIPVIPQVVNFGNESYLEGIELDNAGFYQRLMSSSELPKTAAPPVEQFYNVFKRLEPLGEPILCIHPSSEVSGTVRSALTAKLEFPHMDIRVLDTRLIAGPLATLVQLAAKWATEDVSIDTIEQRLKELAPQGRIYFLVPTLEFLRRGGRIGGAQALVGSLLKIKPILTFREGRVDQFEKVRTMHQALERIKELVISEWDVRNPYLSIMHANAPEAATKLAEELKQLLRVDSIDIYNMPPAIVTHAGPGILAAGFFTP